MTKRERETWDALVFRKVLTGGTLEQLREQLELPGANPNHLYDEQKEKWRQIPAIMYAAVSRIAPVEKLQLLESRGAILRVYDGAQRSLLYTACRNGQPAVVEWVVDKKLCDADTFCEADDYDRPIGCLLARYLKKPHPELWRVLVKIMAECNPDMDFEVDDSDVAGEDVTWLSWLCRNVSAAKVREICKANSRNDFAMRDFFFVALQDLARWRHDAEAAHVARVLMAYVHNTTKPRSHHLRRCLESAYQCNNPYVFCAIAAHLHSSDISEALKDASIDTSNDGDDHNRDPMPMLRLIPHNDWKHLFEAQINGNVMTDKLFWAWLRCTHRHDSLPWTKVLANQPQRWRYLIKESTGDVDKNDNTDFHRVVRIGTLADVKAYTSRWPNPFWRNAQNETPLQRCPGDKPDIRAYLIEYQQWKPRAECSWWWGPYFINASIALLAGARARLGPIPPDVRKLVISYLSRVWAT